MTLYPYPATPDFAKYADDEGVKETFYGLPATVTFCKTCCISNQRPSSTPEFKHRKDSKKSTIHIDEDGICDACKVARTKGTIDWDARRKELNRLCDRYRRDDGKYDCLVPGSGGKDSFYAAHMLKYEFGMHPLTVTWAPHVYTDWGWRNHQAWIHAGFDNALFTPNGKVHRLLTRLAVENLFHPFQPFILGQKNLAPKMAAIYDIPLIFYGENEAEYGNPVSDLNDAKRSWEYFSEQDPENIFLGGVSKKDLLGKFGLVEIDLEPYIPLDPVIIEKKNMEVHYLGYYLKWHPQGAYYYSVENGGFEASPERTTGTYSKYNSIDDKIDDFHYYTTYIKFGIGRATYDASQEVRSGDITREEGVALIRKYDGEYPQRFADEIFNYLSMEPQHFPVASKNFEQPIMDREYFAALTDRFRPPHLWRYTEGEWSLRHTIWAEDQELDHASAIEWIGNPSRKVP